MNGSSHNPAEAKARILVLEPDEHLSTEIISAVEQAVPGAQVDHAHSLEEAQRAVVDKKPDLFVLDLDATYDLGQEFLYDLRTSHPNSRAIVLTARHFSLERDDVRSGAIHFLEKPFPRGDFVDLVTALLHSGAAAEEKFAGTLSDLHVADIIQLKCIGGATSALEFVGPQGEKARVYFENGQVRHAEAAGKGGLAAFNEIVHWKGGKISEVTGYDRVPRTIELDWQLLLMEAVRKSDETADAASRAKIARDSAPTSKRILVVDDSMMLLSFVSEILTEARYQVFSASTAQEGIRAALREIPDLILLDYVLPDMKGDEVSRQLLEDERTSEIPILYMSGFGADLKPDQILNRNVIGSLSKPFTSDLLLKTVSMHLPSEEQQGAAESAEAEESRETGAAAERPVSFSPFEEPADEGATAAGESKEGQAEAGRWQPAYSVVEDAGAAPILTEAEEGLLFAGDTSFFSFYRVLHTIAGQKPSGILRCFWSESPAELLTRNGRILLVTTRNAELYCPEAPITLVNVDEGRVAAARERQAQDGCPVFLTLAQEGLILRDPAQQLVQHHGQKLFAQLWAAEKVRFVFERRDPLPDYTEGLSGDEDLDQWALNVLRFVQYTDLPSAQSLDASCIPAYTREGFDRVQKLRLTVAEAQFASQFNGVRSVAQIAKNLRLDLKFARLSLFRFLQLEIVECWPAATAAKPEKSGIFSKITRTVGFGE